MGLFVEWILEELDDMGYEMPGWYVVHEVLEANGMICEDGNIIGPHGFVADEGGVDGVIIPDDSSTTRPEFLSFSSPPFPFIFSMSSSFPLVSLARFFP